MYSAYQLRCNHVILLLQFKVFGFEFQKVIVLLVAHACRFHLLRKLSLLLEQVGILLVSYKIVLKGFQRGAFQFHNLLVLFVEFVLQPQCGLQVLRFLIVEAFNLLLGIGNQLLCYLCLLTELFLYLLLVAVEVGSHVLNEFLQLIVGKGLTTGRASSLNLACVETLVVLTPQPANLVCILVASFQGLVASSQE